jgi:uncharacterized small protein (DUF1192 family)
MGYHDDGSYVDDFPREDLGHRSYGTREARTREALLRRRIERMEAELAEIEERREKFGPDLDEGDVVTFTKTFSDAKNATRYSYAAIKANGMWYTTGPKSPKAYTWDELTEWFDREGGVYDLRVVTKTAKYPRK